MNSTVGDLAGNRAKILDFCQRAAQQGADIVLTPELSLVGYPPEDLLLRDAFYAKTLQTLQELMLDLATLRDLHVIVGYPILRDADAARFNACSVIVNGQIVATYCKQHLPNDSVFDEKRYFTAANVAEQESSCVFMVKGVKFGLNICEDVWFSDAPLKAKMAGAEVLLVANASPYHMNKQHTRHEVIQANVVKQGMSVVYANLVGGQDELVFDGHSFVMDQQGKICAQLPHFEEDLQIVTFDGATPLPGKFAPELTLEGQIYQALVLGVRDYIQKNGFPGVIIGLSGGVDSALTLAIAVDALGVDKVRTVMMASPYTAEISWLDARDMAQRLGVAYDEIPIHECFTAFGHSLAPVLSALPVLQGDTTEENIQARIRGTMLMALSNKSGAIVLTTGNKSEMAVGYCTLYGDMAGGFAVLKDIAKTWVYRLCTYRNAISNVIPSRILTRPPSAELRPDQTDQDSLPPYEVLDAIMQLYMEENKSIADILAAGYQAKDVEQITRLLKINEYKRRQSSIGVRVTQRGFGRDWRYPITSKFRA